MYSVERVKELSGPLDQKHVDYVLASVKSSTLKQFLLTLFLMIACFVVAEMSHGPAAEIVRFCGGLLAIATIIFGFAVTGFKKAAARVQNSFNEIGETQVTPKEFWEYHKRIFPASTWRGK
ncbi:MAG: hypothetical protein AAFW87_10075 [Pseudomonadota bacterium]